MKSQLRLPQMKKEMKGSQATFRGDKDIKKKKMAMPMNVHEHKENTKYKQGRVKRQ